MSVMCKNVFITVALVCGIVLLPNQPILGSGKTANQENDKLTAVGRTQFVLTCASCHGANAEGADGPGLRKVDLTGTFITARVTNGVKDEMPAFTKFTPRQLKAVTAYILSLQ